MALLTDKFLFLHTPKTGGTYIRKVFDLLFIKGVEKDLHHNCFPELFKHVSFEDLYNKTIICFIRHPLTWYQSRWACRLSHFNGWKGNSLDLACGSNDFNIFVNNCIDYSGSGIGWASREMTRFTDNMPSGFKIYIGKQENLQHDLVSALLLCGALATKADLPPLEKSNVSLNDEMPAHAIAKYDTKTYERVLEADGDFIMKYYGGMAIDHRILF